MTPEVLFVAGIADLLLVFILLLHRSQILSAARLEKRDDWHAGTHFTNHL